VRTVLLFCLGIAMLPTSLQQGCGGDLDNDGYSSDVDCDDSDPDVHPGQEETLGNGIDDDCDGGVDDVPPGASCSEAVPAVSGTYNTTIEPEGEHWYRITLSPGQLIDLTLRPTAADLELVLSDGACTELARGTGDSHSITLRYNAYSGGTVRVGVLHAAGEADSYDLSVRIDSGIAVTSHATSCTVIDATTGQDKELTLTGSLSSFLAPTDGITAMTGYLTQHGQATPVTYASVKYYGGSSFTMAVDLEGVDFAVTNPFTFDVYLDITSNGQHYNAILNWTIVATPERTGFMYNDGIMYGKIDPGFMFRETTSLYFNDESGYLIYGPESYLSSEIIQMSGPSTPPSYGSVAMLYFSVGDSQITSSNEAYYYSMSISYRGTDYLTATSGNSCSGRYGYVFLMDPVDYNLDGFVDYQDLAAVDLETLNVR